MEGAPIAFLDAGMRTDERGASFFFFPEPVDIDLKSLHLVVTEPGYVRGNHAHPTRAEYLFFFGGPGIFAWEENGRIREIEVGQPGQLVRIGPGVPHAYKNTGTATAYILACWGPRLSEGPERVGARILADDGQERVGHA